MFYSQLLLAKKGPLAKVWMAAHWDKKLTKQAIVQTDIRSSAEQLKKPQTPLSLRMSGHLLLGLSRIFARKVQYLYHDSSEAFAHMKSGSRPAIDLDVHEGGGGGNIDMQAQPGGAAAALLLQADDAQLFNFDFGGDGGAIPLVGDHLGGEDWVNVGTQGAWGSQQGGQGAPGSAARSALRMGRGYAPLPHEAADEENFDVPGLAPSAGRSAITGSGSASDAELERARLDGLARKSGGVAGRGSELDSDDNRSVVSENDDSVRRGRRGRSSLLPGNADLEGGVAGKASLKGRLGAGVDAADADLLGIGAAHDEFGLGDLMGLTGAFAGGNADDVEMAAGTGQRGAAHEEYQPAPGEGAGDYDYYADAGAQGGGAEVPPAAEDEEEGGGAAAAAAGGAFGTPKAARAAAAAAAAVVEREVSEASSLSAHGGSSESVGGGSDADDAMAAAAAAAKAESAKASRAAKKAQRDAERLAALQRKPDDKTMLPSDVIKGWLSDTSKITKPLLQGEALAEHLRRRHEEVSHARVKATMAPGPAAAKRFAATFPFPGAWSALATLDFLDACPPDAAHTGPDGDALRTVPLVVDIDAEFAGCYGVHGPGVPRGPAAFARTTLSMARLMISHVHGTAHYGRDPELADDEEEEAAASAAAAAAALGSASKPSASAAAPAHRGAASGKAAAADDDNDDAMAGSAGGQRGAAHEEYQPAPGEGAGDYDYYADAGAQGFEVPGANGFALNADVQVDGDLAGPGVDEHGNVAGLGRRSAATACAGSPGEGSGAAGSVASSADRAPAKDKEAGGAAAGAGDAASVRSSGAPGGDDESDARSSVDGVAAAAAAAQLLSASARKAAGHHGAFLGNERTAKMLSILAEEMTGPALPDEDAAGAGAKRKSRPAPAHNLADLRHGKGTPSDPVSFFELAEGSTAPVAALSFYQLLTLKTLDVIQIKQAEPYGDVLITRTAHFAPAVAEMKKKAAAAAQH